MRNTLIYLFFIDKKINFLKSEKQFFSIERYDWLNCFFTFQFIQAQGDWDFRTLEYNCLSMLKNPFII